MGWKQNEEKVYSTHQVSDRIKCIIVCVPNGEINPPCTWVEPKVHFIPKIPHTHTQIILHHKVYKTHHYWQWSLAKLLSKFLNWSQNLYAALAKYDILDCSYIWSSLSAASCVSTYFSDRSCHACDPIKICLACINTAVITGKHTVSLHRAAWTRYKYCTFTWFS